MCDLILIFIKNRKVFRSINQSFKLNIPTLISKKKKVYFVYAILIEIVYLPTVKTNIFCFQLVLFNFSVQLGEHKKISIAKQ